MILARLPLFTALLFCFAIAGGIYWQLAPLFQNINNNAINTAKNTAKTIKPITKKIHNIANFNLFGDQNLKASNTIVIQENLPKTKLKLTLTGVLVSPNPLNAGALILGPDQQTQHYKINDDIVGGVTLKQVFTDRVVVNRSGRLENLYFTEYKSIGLERYTAYEDDVETPTKANARPRNMPTPASTGLSAARSRSIKDRLSKLKKRLMSNKQ